MSAVHLQGRRAPSRDEELSRCRLRARRSRVGAGASAHRRNSRRRGARQRVPPLLWRRGSIADPAPVSQFAQRAQAGYLSRSRAGCPRPSAAFAHSLLAVPVYGAGNPPAARQAPAPPLRISLRAACRLFDFAPDTLRVSRRVRSHAGVVWQRTARIWGWAIGSPPPSHPSRTSRTSAVLCHWVPGTSPVSRRTAHTSSSGGLQQAASLLPPLPAACGRRGGPASS